MAEEVRVLEDLECFSFGFVKNPLKGMEFTAYGGVDNG